MLGAQELSAAPLDAKCSAAPKRGLRSEEKKTTTNATVEVALLGGNAF